MAASPGTSLGPYEFTAKIGAGGMGEVYRARDTKLDRDVALKVLMPAKTPTECSGSRVQFGRSQAPAHRPEDVVEG